MVSLGSIKAILISTGVAAVALLLKVSVPVAVDFSVSRAPILWSSLLSWLKPPYLYFITNGIIITIAASSRFYRSTDEEIVSGADKIHTEQISEPAPPRQLVVMAVDRIPDFGFETVSLPPLVDDAAGLAAEVVYAEEEMLSEATEATPAAVLEEEEEEEEEKRVVVESSDLVAEDGYQFAVMASPEIASENLPPAEKPLVSARFAQRKSLKSSPEGGGARALRVTRPKQRHETLENTWKMITEGKSMPLTRHFRKCDTWQNQGREVSDVPGFKKSETFRDRTNYYETPEKQKGAAPVKLKKEASPSQDELNRRVEAFIKKFNDDMRLQRLESLRQYKEMVGRRI